MNNAITSKDLKNLVKKTSGNGIISIYINANPKIANTKKWDSLLNENLMKLKKEYPGHDDLYTLADEIYKEIKSYPVKEKHKSIIYFRSKKPKWTWKYTALTPVTDSFVWDTTTYTRPLVTLLHQYPRLGLILISGDKVKFITWQQGNILNVKKDEITLFTPEWKKYQGPTMRTTTTEKVASQEDFYKNRLEMQERKYIKNLLSTVRTLDKDNKWEHLVIIGKKELTRFLEKELPPALNDRLLGVINKVMVNNNHQEVSDEIISFLKRTNRTRELKEIENLIEHANPNGRAALGPTEVLKSLQLGQVGRLYFDINADLKGFRDIEGKCYMGRPAKSKGLVTENNIIERMIEFAFATKAAVIPVSGKAAEMLKKHKGVGALLRY